MPDYKVVHNTKKSIDNKVNLMTKIKIKPTNNDFINILPKINNNYSNIEKESESNYFNDNSKSNIYHRRLMRNSSMDYMIKNNFSL
jgi:hypothetical protein